MTRTALVQDWFFTPGGSERVAFELAGLLPSAPVYTTFADAPSVEALGSRLHTWPLQRVFPGTRSYRRFLPLYPLWFGGLDLRGYDLVVSSSSAFAHGVRVRGDALHVAYVHNPMRFAWDTETYLAGSSFGGVARLGARALRGPLRRWDRRAAAGPDVIIANSATVAGRIRDLWDRDADVLYPPVETSAIPLSTRDDGFLLVAARLLAYRRIDLAVAAATRLGREFVVVGDGPERAHLESIAGPTVRFAGMLERAELIDLFGRCHAYVVPGVEDFGIAPVEAMAAGKPVVGFGEGGVAESVLDGETGILFDAQTVDDTAAAIEALDARTWDPARIRARAQEFDTEVFRARWRELLADLGFEDALAAEYAVVRQGA